MRPLADAVIDWSALLEVLWASLVGGVGVTTTFALAILGATRAVDLRRDGHALAAGAYGVLAALATTAVIAAIIFGVIVMTSKD